jgi:WD40 repeat protein
VLLPPLGPVGLKKLKRASQTLLPSFSTMDQFDYGIEKRKRLVLSSSIVNRRRPAVSTSIASTSSTPYVTHLISPSEAVLLSYSDDGLFRYLDKSTLRTVNSVKWDKGGNCTCLITADQGYMAAGQKGVVGYWDARQGKELVTLAGPSRAPYLSLATSGTMVAAGTELQGADASIDVWWVYLS